MATPVAPPRPDEADDTTPLLGQVTGRDELLVPDPNIYIEVVEAPWDSISQRTAFIIRLAISLLMSSLLLWHFIVETLAQSLGIFLFRATNISWIAQTVYMWLVTVSAPPPPSHSPEEYLIGRNSTGPTKLQPQPITPPGHPSPLHPHSPRLPLHHHHYQSQYPSSAYSA